MLIIFRGLPGAGKTTLAKALAEYFSAVYIRIDTLEEAMESSSIGKSEEAGYLAGYDLARDNLMLGNVVVADSVNSINTTRKAWRSVAAQAEKIAVEIEVICTDKKEHQQRIEERKKHPSTRAHLTWQDVMNREYDVWETDPIVVDTAGTAAEKCIEILLSQLPSPQPSPRGRGGSSA